MHEDIGRLLIRREEMVQEASVQRCACGHGILCEVKRGGIFRLSSVLRRRADEPDPPREARELPGCDEWLGLLAFLARIQPG